MKRIRRVMTLSTRAGFLVLIGFGAAARMLAHCDTMDGPVVASARVALDTSNVVPVLKWVRPQDEEGIRFAFARAVEVRSAGSKATRELADLWFFETLVRIHRAGEGAPYTGLAPAGTLVDSAILAVDRALATGEATELVRLVTTAAADGTRERFARAADAKRHAEESVLMGRAFVAAYVELTHYVERLVTDATTAAAPGAHAGKKDESAHEH